MRFNPPPNWPPAPPGWTPPPDWRPDPNWGPPPPGWQLWVQDGPASTGRSRTPLIIGGVVGALVLVVVGVLTVVLLTRTSTGGEGTDATTTTSVEASSDEDQIEDTVAAFEKAWNDEDFDAMEPIVCEELHSDPEFSEDEFLAGREGAGRLNLTVTDVDITGDKAVVSIEQQGESPNDFDFVREDGEWKWCEL